MPNIERFPQPAANDNNEQFPPESFTGMAQQLVYISESRGNGFFDTEMLEALLKNEKPDYQTDTPEGLKKSRSYALLVHLRQVMDDPDSLEEERNEAFGMLLAFAKQGSPPPEED